jgi:long-subunit acyl-CoA synthetase (AMP-forming)
VSAGIYVQLAAHAKRTPDRIVMQNITEAGREEYTFSRTVAEIERLAAHLRSIGIRAGDRVGILMENHPRWGVSFLAER